MLLLVKFSLLRCPAGETVVVATNSDLNTFFGQLEIPDAVVLKIDDVTYKSRQMHFHYPSEHTIANYT